MVARVEGEPPRGCINMRDLPNDATRTPLTQVVFSPQRVESRKFERLSADICVRVITSSGQQHMLNSNFSTSGVLPGVYTIG